MKTREHDGAGGRRRSPVRPWLLLLALPLLLVQACSEPGQRLANQRPSVELTGGPAQGDRVPYLATFYWRGWDQDGVIDHYQVALDLPDSLVTPALEGVEDPRIAWLDTTATSVTLVLSTPYPDTTALAGWVLMVRSADPAGLYRGGHTIYVRAVDNEGGVSRAASVTFTATNISPSSKWDFSCLGSGSTHYDVGARLKARMLGRDPDSPEGGLLPDSYEYKLIPGIGTSTTDAQYAVTVSPGPAYPWNLLSAGIDSAYLELPQRDYLVAVRAVDLAGAKEDQFELGRNAILLTTHADRGLPVFTVTETSLGSSTFTGDDGVFEAEIPAGYCPRFEISAGTDGSCLDITGYDWGLDVANPAAEGPGSGFHGWTTTPAIGPICLDTEGVHALTVRVRDELGQRAEGTILLRVVTLTRDRDVLYVDDFLMSHFGAISDEMMDAWARAMLLAAGYAESDIYQIDTFGAGDLNFVPTLLKFSDLARYKLVVWSNWGTGYAAASALVSAASCPGKEVLRTYLDAGGAAWIYGSQIFGTFLPTSSTSCTATLGYDDTHPLEFGNTGFGPEYLGLAGARFYNVKLNSRVNGMVRAIPTAGALAEQFPVVETDSTVYSAATRGGVDLVDALFTPIHSAGLDTLYTMTAVSPSSGFQGKPVAFRYLDPDPGSTRGPRAVFGFPFHVLKQGAGAERTGVQGMARSMIDWFRSHGG